MNILKTKVSLPTVITALAIVAVVGVGGLVRALTISGTPEEVRELVGVDKQIAPDEELGGTNSPFHPYSWMSFNGLIHHYFSKDYASATTTVCAIQSPNATSTLTFASASMNTSTTTAFALTMAKAATAYATTTLIAFDSAYNANDQVDYVATSTFSVTGQDYMDARVFAPNQWFVVSMAGGTPATSVSPGFISGYGQYSPVGKCQAEFIQQR